MSESNRTHTGEAALATLRDLLPTGPDARKLADRLFSAGFIVVPLPYKKPARRGIKPKPYTGPAMIGTSHSAKLAG